MGDKDLVKALLERRGTIHYGRVLMKPGKPLTFATVSPKGFEGDPSKTLLVFGLPGNPVSSLVTFHLVVVPVLRKLRGDPYPELMRVRAKTVCVFVCLAVGCSVFCNVRFVAALCLVVCGERAMGCGTRFLERMQNVLSSYVSSFRYVRCVSVYGL